MASKNLYFGNLPFGTTSADLEQLFGQYGTVTKAQVITDRETGRSRGFAFVEMSDGVEAAINALKNVEFHGRRLTVNEAKPREERPRAGGYGGVAAASPGAVKEAAADMAAAAVAAATAAGEETVTDCRLSNSCRTPQDASLGVRHYHLFPRLFRLRPLRPPAYGEGYDSGPLDFEVTLMHRVPAVAFSPPSRPRPPPPRSRRTPVRPVTSRSPKASNGPS